jgi:DNA-binding PadR family transcriptional regulator
MARPKHGPGSGRWREWFGFEAHGHRHEPWGWRRRFFESGEVRLALLSLVAERPMHGYEIMKEIESRSGGVYKASAGTVYPNLQQLEDEGLIKSTTDENGKRIYSITAEGKKVLAAEAEAVGRIWSRASAWDDWSDAFSPAAMEVMGPAMRLARAAFRAAARGDARQVEQIRATLNKAADDLEKNYGGGAQ